MVILFIIGFFSGGAAILNSDARMDKFIASFAVYFFFLAVVAACFKVLLS